MSWRVRALEVRSCTGGLRWTIEAWTDSIETTVTADTSYDGQLRYLQSDEYCGATAGDEALDFEVAQHITDVLALRSVLQSLGQIDRQRWGRVQGPADRRHGRWAA